MTLAYEHWLLHKPPLQPATPSASSSSNKRQCTESTSSLHIEPSYTQAEYERALSHLAEEWASHTQTKATLEAKILLRTKTEFLYECTQHWNETQVELIHSLKSELNDSRTSHEDLGHEIRRSNTMDFV